MGRFISVLIVFLVSLVPFYEILGFGKRFSINFLAEGGGIVITVILVAIGCLYLFESVFGNWINFLFLIIGVSPYVMLQFGVNKLDIYNDMFGYFKFDIYNRLWSEHFAIVSAVLVVAWFFTSSLRKQ